MTFKKLVCISAALLSLILPSCTANSGMFEVITDSKENREDISSQNNAHVITSDNYEMYFGDSPTDSIISEPHDSAYFIYNNTVWSTTQDGFVAEIIPGKGVCYLADGLSEVLNSSSLSENQLVGVLVREWSSYYDNTLSKDDNLSVFSDFGFEIKYSTDNTINEREQEYINSFPDSENYFTVIGDIKLIRAFIEHCSSTDGAYVLHLAPCLYGYYRDDAAEIDFDIIPQKSEICIDDTLYEQLVNSSADSESLYAVSVKLWDLTTVDNKVRNKLIRDFVEYMESLGFDVLYYKNGYRGSMRQMEYINESSYDLVVRGTYETIKTGIKSILETEHSLSFGLAWFVY